MSTFLNLYLDEHFEMADLDGDAIAAEFGLVMRLLKDGPGRSALRLGGNQVNAAHTDAVLVGLTLALRSGTNVEPDDCITAIDELLANEKYIEAVSGSTSHRDSVINRLQIAVEVFGTI